MSGEQAAAAQARHAHITAQFSRTLDNLFTSHRVHDGKQLTEGDIMASIGMIIGMHCKSPDRVEAWIRAIGLSARAAHSVKEMEQRT